MKAIVSIVGKDQVGIIANVCSELAACNINILEISQKIMDGFFTMMLVTDLSGCDKPLDEVSDRLQTCTEGKQLSRPYSARGHVRRNVQALRCCHAEFTESH